MTLLQNEINSIIKSLENKPRLSRTNAPKISIIVPVFNSEKYLAKCLLSLLNQTEKEIEIIIVNDGSTDDSEKIAKIFGEHDERITIINQEHRLQAS